MIPLEQYDFKCELKNQTRRIPLILLVSILIYGVEFSLTSVFDWREALSVFLYTLLLWQGNALFSILSIRWFPTIEKTGARIAVNLVFAVVYTVMMVYLVDLVLFAQSRPFRTNFIDFLIGFMVTLVISLIFQTGAYFILWKESIREAERLKRASMESELKVLNNQVNPHFLFNSLNTLMSLIPDDSQLALEYTRKFAEVYRYVLQSRDHELVSLKTELEFCRNYCFLLQIRFGDNFSLVELIDQEAYDLQVPPLVVQMLIENATKHNAVNHKSQLEIVIRTLGENRLEVKNNLNNRLQPAEGTGTGLDNIRKRYHFFTTDKVEIDHNPTDFKVRLPLIKVARYEGSYS